MPPRMKHCGTVGVVGTNGAGKTSSIGQLTDLCPYDEFDPTLGEDDHKIVTVDDEKVVIQVFEPPTDPKLSALSAEMKRQSSGFLMFFSLTNKESFEELKPAREQLLGFKEKDSFPFVLVGCKSDLKQDRVISPQECEALAREFGCKYIETSAEERVNVEEPFAEIVREIRRYERRTPTVPTPEPKSKTTGCFDRCVVL